MKEIIKLFSLLFLPFALCQSESNSCPSAEDIKPCICKIDNYNSPWVSCEDIKSVDQLRQIAKGMNGVKLSLFMLANSSIGILPADIFQDVEIKSISITFTNLTSLSESPNRPPFLGLEDSLETLEIRNGFVTEATPLSRVSMSHLKKIYILQMEGNMMPVIPNDWFEMGPYQLRDLYLLDTNVSVIGSHAFEALENLQMFALTGGRIKTIAREIFSKPAVRLMSIDLSNNKIETLPDDFFSQMPSLQEVFLENNALTTISEVVFAQVWNTLTHVFFYGSPIDCNKDIKWIYKYRLPEAFRGYCASPDKLKHKLLNHLTLKDFE